MPTSESKPVGRRAPTPLWVITFFVSTAETVLGIAVTHTSGGIQIALTAFVISFPALVALGFFLILWFKPHHFYAPGEYVHGVSPREFIDALMRADPSHRYGAGEALRLFWKPDGRTIDKKSAVVLKDWMKANGLGRVSMTVFVHGNEFADMRVKAVEDLKLQVEQGT